MVVGLGPYPSLPKPVLVPADACNEVDAAVFGDCIGSENAHSIVVATRIHLQFTAQGRAHRKEREMGSGLGVGIG